MKKDDIVKIKQYKYIDKHVKGGPGWSDEMNKYCGSEWRIIYIDNIHKWIKLEEINDYVWHKDWLINENDMDMFEFKEFEI